MTEERGSAPRMKFTWTYQVRAVVLSSWLNVLLLFVPAGFIVAYLHVKLVVILLVNFIAIIPLSGMLGLRMDQLMLQIGDGLTILVWITFCNIVQVITSIFLLKSNQLVVLETSLIGSTIILTLFNMGGAFIWGGWKRRRQHFNRELARTMSSMLSISVFGLLIPTAFDKFSVTPESSLAGSSRGTSLILITVYLFYALYEYTTNGDLGIEQEAPVPKFVPQPLSSSTPTDESEEAKLSITTSTIVLIIGTTILAFNTQFMTDSISGIAQEDMGQAFIGMVLIPMLSNDITVFQNAAQDKMNSAIQCALGRSLQITLLVIPGTVLLAWIMQRDWTLSFDGFYMAILFGSTLVVQAGIGNGNSNW
ncbi:hypothetical protein V8E51_001170 [Hyaloscypha variabilis]